MSSRKERARAKLIKRMENLSEDELWWTERYEFLESRGYRLRPRFRPGWVPSWLNTGRDPLDFEDSRFHLVRVSWSRHLVPSHRTQHDGILDATRLSDGKQVVLKAVLRDGNEVRIAMMLSSLEALKDPMNHCVPILDYFGDLTRPGPDFIVMPLLRVFYVPDFETVAEILDFVKQTLEVLFLTYSCLR